MHPLSTQYPLDNQHEDHFDLYSILFIFSRLIALTLRSLSSPLTFVEPRLNQLLGLQKDLEATREASASKEAELRAQIDKLRAEKREIEARSAGVDLGAMREGDVLVQQVRP